MKEMAGRKNWNYAKCRGCGRLINGGEYCSYCKERIDIFRDIKTMINNQVKKEERKKKNHERQMRYVW